MCTYNSAVYHQKIKKKNFKLHLVSDLSHRKSNYRFIWWFRVVSDLSPTLGKIGHQWFFKKKWYPWWQNQWFRLCNQWSHNSYKLFWRKNPKKIIQTIFNFDLNVNKCPILPLFTVGIVPTNRRSGVKMFLSGITAPIVLAQLIYFLIRRCHVNRIFILQIRSAMPILTINAPVV